MSTMKALNPFARFGALMIIVFLLGACRAKQSTSGGNNNGGGGLFTKKILVGVQVTSVELLNWPRFGRDNEKWDAYAMLNTEPDVYVRFTWNNEAIWQSEVKEDVSPGSPLNYVSSLPVQIKPFDQSILVEVFDEDGVSDDDNMGYFNVRFKDYEKQDHIELRNSTGELVVRLGVQWQYQ